MAKEDRHDRNRDPQEAAPQPGNLDLDDAASIDENWQDEELERTSMGWQAEDMERPATVPEIDAIQTDDLDDSLLDAAGDALIEMKAREMRRGQFRTPGDDLNPGIDHGENAPKEDHLPDRSKANRS